jgi:hypothetical protein
VSFAVVTSEAFACADAVPAGAGVLPAATAVATAVTVNAAFGEVGGSGVGKRSQWSPAGVLTGVAGGGCPAWLLRGERRGARL